MITQKSKIVISGANGAVGEILFEKFQKNNYLVSKLDLNNQKKQDVFIHLAAKTLNTNEILDSNIEYLKKCIEYCKKTDIKYFVFFSTVSVYGNIDSLNINEESNFSNKPNIYGLSKLIGEELLKQSDMSVLNLRLPAILTKNTKNTFIYSLYEKLEKNQDITITNSTKIFNNIVDVGSIYESILNYDFKEKNRTYLIASKQEKTLKEVVVFLKEILNSKSKIIENSSKSNFYNINISKSQDDLIYQAKDIFDVLKQWIDLLKGRN
ncbi:MAG: SDR family oxidoreductase [Poseidonibacter sp.]|uniref:SDR family oxidoreductase n=1 Tax=Poseidonibacter sp. TaxID=2321188 RepID=UPI00359E834D